MDKENLIDTTLVKMDGEATNHRFIFSLTKEDKLVEYENKEYTKLISGSHTYIIKEPIDKLKEIQERL